MNTYRLLRPALFRTDPEVAHDLAINALKLGLHPRDTAGDPALLHQSLFGLEFANPVGMAAGFDKNAEVADPLLALGYGFVEVGTVTPRPQPGNPRPRMFRLVDDEALINRLGFNSAGHAPAKARLEARVRGGVVGVNIGANKDSVDRIADYAAGVQIFGKVADYLTVNISSPNTPGLRDLQERGELGRLLDTVMAARPAGVNVPILVKIAPDLDDQALAAIIETALEKKIAGLIISNTTIARDGVTDSRLAGEAGGLSGRPLFAPSTRILAKAHILSEGRLPLVGVGGIGSGADALVKIKAGASLVQLYTAMVYEGPGLAMRIKRELAALMKAERFSTMGEIVGTNAGELRNFGL